MGLHKAALWSPEAQSDIRQVSEYYERLAGPRTAENVLRDIVEAIDLLEAHPYGGRARREIRPNLRSFPVDRFVVFYQVVEETVQIVRILDGRRDIETQLAP